uniref:Potassium voltage-gated channel subfamily E regulatory subunit 3 n=1 Tax=Cyanistes caeruleus TaxID=156563 RepID=A0A8C0U5Y1_CYACU
MGENNRTEPWHQSLQAVLNALNQTLHGAIPCPGQAPAGTAATTHSGHAGRNDNAYILILGYTRSRKVDKRSDPYHVYIKNRVSMI